MATPASADPLNPPTNTKPVALNANGEKVMNPPDVHALESDFDLCPFTTISVVSQDVV